MKKQKQKSFKKMFKLSAPAGPRWLDLPQGVRVHVRPVTLAERAAMESYAGRRIAALRTEIQERDEVGAPRDGLPDLDDPDILRGLSTQLVAEGLAKACIMGWEGVGDAAGAPAPLTPANLAAFANSDLADAFVQGLMAPLDEAASEGNGSAPGPAGAGAPGATGADPANPTAPAAPPA